MTDEQLARLTNVSAEQSVLGGMLRENAVIGEVVNIVGKDDFTADAHQRIFAVVKALWDAGSPVDGVTVAEELKRRSEIADVTYPYLGTLLDAAPTAANAGHYAGIVRENSLLRSLARAGEEIAQLAAVRGGPAKEVLELAEKNLANVADLAAGGTISIIQEVLAAAYDRIDARIEARRSGERSVGVLTGWHELDRLTGGLQDGELVLIAARTSVGKTSLALGLAVNVAVHGGAPVYFASLEQGIADLGERLLSSEARVDSYKLRTGNLAEDDPGKLTAAGDRLQKWKFYFDDSPRQTVWRIAANARRLYRKHGIRLAIVDYLQLVEGDDRRANRQEQVAATSRRLKSLARELKIPVVALAQLNREADGQRPKLSHLRESGSQEQDADTVLLLHQDESTPGNRDDHRRQATQRSHGGRGAAL